MKCSLNTCLLTWKNSPHPGRPLHRLRSAHTAELLAQPGPPSSRPPTGFSQQPHLTEAGLSAGVDGGSLATQSCGFSPLLSLSRAAGPPSWGGLDLLPGAPQHFVLGLHPGSNWARGREQNGCDLILFVCLFLGP